MTGSPTMIPNLCPAHLDAVAVEERRAGTHIVMLTKVQLGLFQLYAGDKTVQRRAGYDEGPPEQLADVARLGTLAAAQGCLACWAGADRFGALLLHCATGGTPGAKGQVYGEDPKMSRA